MKKTLSKIIAAAGMLSLMAMTTQAVQATDNDAPGDVENLKGTALNGAVQLTWDAATDNVGVDGYQVHYGTSAVDAPGETYDDFVDVGKVLSYTVSGLENGETYYFSAIAYDAAGNESEAWATEVSLEPDAAGGSVDDDEAPQVSEAEAVNINEVKVEFSEAVVLPEEDAEDAFTIENEANFEPLIVTDAVMDEDDETNKTVILTTEDQEDGETYKLTVTIDVEDTAGNPIISGTSDTAIFTGTDAEKAPDDTAGPKILTVEAVDRTHIIVNFDETVVLSIDPSEDFTITAEDDASVELDVLGVELGVSTEGIEDAAAIITTSEQEAISYVVEINGGLKDEDGNVGVSSEEFTGIATEEDPNNEDDVIPPKDVANFLAKTLFEGGKFTVNLSWNIPDENIEDVVEQIIYMSMDKGEEYDETASLEGDMDEYSVKDLEAGEYWFKITQKDAAGNESEGVISKVVLSETGPGLIGLVAVSLGLGRVIARRKKQV